MNRSSIRILLAVIVAALVLALLWQARAGREAVAPDAAPDAAATAAAGVDPTPADASADAPAAMSPAPVGEVAVQPLPLAGPAADRLAEFSSLTRYGNDFILLPQYPGRFGDAAAPVVEEATTKGEGQLFALAVDDVLARIDGQSAEPLTPRPVAFKAPESVTGLKGFEGFEAIAFLEDQVFLTVETQDDERTRGFVVSGSFEVDDADHITSIQLDERAPLEIPLPANLDNMSLESLLVTPSGLLTFFEANGAKVNPQPMDQRLGFDLSLKDQLPFPAVEYRITDATELDADGCFWAINYRFPGDDETLPPAEDAIAVRWGQGPTHATFPQVERLIPLCYADGRLNLADRAPIQLQLVDAETSRNWEGIERLDDRGFLLVTDKFPGTELGFVAAPR
ncbi:MAG TPA: hypothetical protein PLZ56_14470 [Anaerolineae bacterium]|nr:hypothetical protein [Anaerolineae bacterium]